MVRATFAAVIAAIGFLLSSCADGDRWGGFVLGQPAPTGTYDPAPSAEVADQIPPPHALYLQHAVTIPDAPEFPWQEASAQLDRQRRVIAVTLSIACCDMLPEYDVALSAEAIRALEARERTVPDRYEDNVGPPGYRTPKLDDIGRFISVGDMTAYGQAALKQAVARLGAPTKQAIEPLNGSPLSYLDDLKVLRVHWARMGPAGPKDFAVMDIGKSQICLTVAATGGRQLPVQGGCAGLDLGCYDQFYPATAPNAGAPTEALEIHDAEYCRKL